MLSSISAALGIALALGLIFAVAAASAATRTTGNESFRGRIIAPAEAGTRKVVSTIIVAQGVFEGVGVTRTAMHDSGNSDAMKCQGPLSSPAGASSAHLGK